MLTRLAAGRVIAVFWLLAAVVLYLACSCIGPPHVVALVAGGLLVLRPRNRIVHLLSFAASTLVFIVLFGGIARDAYAASISTLATALATLTLAAVIAGMSLMASRRPDSPTSA
jgi:hypothetical protein